MLSFVEFYRPSYVLIENVPGLLDHKLFIDGDYEPESDNNEGTDREEGEEIVIEMGMVKFIVRVLISLG
jgi:DNA (cytosine-5)-methyltransferase 1